GVTFTVCFVTGVLSHLIQDPPSWFQWPSRPAGLYRVTQGVHVATGLASIPLLLAKLWVVFPKLFAWPPFRSVAHLVERLAIFPLVAGGVFELFSGLGHAPVVPVAVRLPLGALLGRLDHHRRPRRAPRRQVGYHPVVAVRPVGAGRRII